MGLIMKALEVAYAKPMYVQCIVPCGMQLLIAGFTSMEYLHGEAGLGYLSFEFEFICSL